MRSKHRETSSALVEFLNSTGTRGRGRLQRATGNSIAFEVDPVSTAVRMSEVLTDVHVRCGDRVLYDGRAVAGHVVDAGSSLSVEGTLVDAWRDTDALGVLADPGRLAPQAQAFVTQWLQSRKLHPQFKMLVRDCHTFLSDLRVWLEQAELALNQLPADEAEMTGRALAAKLSEPVRPMIQQLFADLNKIAPEIPREQVPLHEDFMRRELHPLTLCSPFVFRTFTKPLGYAGGYGMINMILGEPRVGRTLYAKTLNALLLEADAAEAHRNRIRELVCILDRENRRWQQRNRPLRVLSVGCGPAQEVRDFMALQPDPGPMKLTLMDFCPEAMAFCQRETTDLKQRRASTIETAFVKASIEELLQQSAADGEGHEKPQYELVYCAGLFDYLVDSVCERLLSLFNQWVVPGGLVVATNVHPSNRSRALMEYLLDWKVFHRTNEHFLRLAKAPGDSSVYAEPTGVNIFVTTRKPE